ncbi:MAG: hypothetical protein IJ680_03890 [Paludibacteraceae bacterium]|nr:hypothetical protein [Paludibacteraceae bacterium]
MKKFFSMMLIAVAMFGFVACDNTEDMSDTELAAAILKKEMFWGKVTSETNKVVDGKYITAIFEEEAGVRSYALYMTESRHDAKKEYEDEEAFNEGTWTVTNGELILTQNGGNSVAYKLEKEGKRIVIDTDVIYAELD